MSRKLNINDIEVGDILARNGFRCEIKKVHPRKGTVEWTGRFGREEWSLADIADAGLRLVKKSEINPQDIDGYIGQVEVRREDGVSDIYFFTSHVSQGGGVCWEQKPNWNLDDLRLDNTSILTWCAPHFVKRAFEKYAKEHDGEWRLLSILPVKRHQVIRYEVPAAFAIVNPKDVK